jgi:hypothetical protein
MRTDHDLGLYDFTTSTTRKKGHHFSLREIHPQIETQKFNVKGLQDIRQFFAVRGKHHEIVSKRENPNVVMSIHTVNTGQCRRRNNLPHKRKHNGK